MQPPEETDPNAAAKRLLDGTELAPGEPLEKSKKAKLGDQTQVRYQQLLARLLEQEQAKQKTIHEIKLICPGFNPTTFLRTTQGAGTPTKGLVVDSTTGDKAIPEATRDLRVKRAQQKEMVTLFNRMVTSTTEDTDLGIEKQKLQDFFQEITATLDPLEQLSPSVFWKYTRGSKYKAETEQSKFYKTVHRWGIRTLHGVRWNNPTDENDARRIQEHFEQLAQFGLCLDRGMIDQRLAVLIEEQKNTASKPSALSAKADSSKVLNVTEADDASSVSSAVVSVGGPRISVPPSISMAVGDLIRPEEEPKFRQFILSHMVDLFKKQQQGRGT